MVESFGNSRAAEAERQDAFDVTLDFWNIWEGFADFCVVPVRGALDFWNIRASELKVPEPIDPKWFGSAPLK